MRKRRSGLGAHFYFFEICPHWLLYSLYIGMCKGTNVLELSFSMWTKGNPYQSNLLRHHLVHSSVPLSLESKTTTNLEISSSPVIVLCTSLTYQYQEHSTLVLSKSKGLSEIRRPICSSTYQICRIEAKRNQTTTYYKWICNFTP